MRHREVAADVENVAEPLLYEDSLLWQSAPSQPEKWYDIKRVGRSPFQPVSRLVFLRDLPQVPRIIKLFDSQSRAGISFLSQQIWIVSFQRYPRYEDLSQTNDWLSAEIRSRLKPGTLVLSLASFMELAAWETEETVLGSSISRQGVHIRFYLDSRFLWLWRDSVQRDNSNREALLP